mmetsp:Transcript_15248/g.28497  ORF Transcript_15248/g.28497 Transcript_15248/m.28497 type:complete len:317 (-) Transcript_15248:324-1274(-)
MARRRNEWCWQHLVLSLVVIAAWQRLDGGYAYSNSARPTTSRPPLSFQEFRFAPNGVCVYPQYFVEYSKGTSEKQDDKNKHNSDNQDSAKPNKYFTMKNVPGDGDCMFLAVALAAATSMGLGGNDALLRAISRETRNVVAQVLSAPKGNLYISPGNTVSSRDLLQSAVRQEPTINTVEEYLEALRTEGRDGGLYGGGPELAVLANVLRRPISIYEVDKPRLRKLLDHGVDNVIADDNDDIETKGSILPIVCKGSFGEGIFEDPCETAIKDSAVLLSNQVQSGAYSWRLHVLVLNVSPVEKHACVLLPQTHMEDEGN